MIASESQSTSTSFTFCTFPDSSPFIHNLFLDLLQNHELPVFCVSSSDSLFAYARVKTSLEFTSCTITGTRPSLFAKSISPIFYSSHHLSLYALFFCYSLTGTPFSFRYSFTLSTE